MSMIAADVANESLFPGNAAALGELIASLKDGRILALTGAGTSVPLVSAWSPLLRDLIKAGLAQGFILAGDEAYLQAQVDDDPLELAATLEELYTKQRFRARLSDVFDIGERITEAHELIVSLPLHSVVTLNYDAGLSTAFVRASGRMPILIRSTDSYELMKWQHDQVGAHGQLPIIHWHGNASAPEHIVFTANDYKDFYNRPEVDNFVGELWRSRHLLAIGFGFKDPFLTRIAESVLRNLETGNSHFALIGVKGGQQVSSLVRRDYARKFRLSPVFYQVRDNEDGSEDHSDLVQLLKHLVAATRPDGGGADPAKDNTIDLSTTDIVRSESASMSQIDLARSEFEQDLLVGVSERLLYVNPRLRSQTEFEEQALGSEGRPVSIAEIIASNQSFAIAAPHEYGGTTLARRLAYDLSAGDQEGLLADASELPDYKARLQRLPGFRRHITEKRRALILDNFSEAEHERLLTEISGLQIFDRYILVCRGAQGGTSGLDDWQIGIKFQHISLVQLQREDIRSLANQLYDTFDADMVSAAVEKTYNDLLDLCIPLTPSNIVMYLTIIYREGGFVALNRLQIMDRYIRDLLQRPSDAYRDSFNVDSKVDLLSSFIYKLFNDQKATFKVDDWNEFCEGEMQRSLSKFDKDAILSDLLTSRIVVKLNNLYVFKYKLFYSFLLGRYVGQRPSLLPEFLEQEQHLAVDGLVEALAGSSKDNTLLVTSLILRLENSLQEFNDQYKLSSFDPYRPLEWALTADEEERVWAPVAKRLASGPDVVDEVDRVKRSILAEQKTADQAVVVREFNRIEKSISFNQGVLVQALRESTLLDGTLKVRAMNAIFDSYLKVMQIGFLFSPIIATRRYFVWNNVAFVNNFFGNGRYEPEAEASPYIIAGAIPPAVTGQAIKEIGSKRLGQLFKHMFENEGLEGFKLLVCYTMIVRTKPDTWESTSRAIIDRFGRKDLYLNYLLRDTLRQFRQEVNTGSERGALKRLVATIQAKRQLKKASPTASAVTGVLKTLEGQNYFQEDAKPTVVQ